MTDTYPTTLEELRQAFIATYVDAERPADVLDARLDRFIAKVYADGMRSVADWIDGGTPRAYGFEHPCDPPGVRTEPGKKERELMGIADATREAASRIEEKADRIERGER